MNKIIRMAKEAGAARLHSTGNIIFGVNALQHFVELIVAAEERDRLAQPETVIQARKEGNLIVVDLPQVPTGSGGISKREWVGLTDEQIEQCAIDDGSDDLIFARAIEAKLKENNYD